MGGSQSKSTTYSTAVPDTSSEHSSSTFRNPESHSSIILPTIWGMCNFFDLFHFSCNKFSSNNFLGQKTNDSYQWTSYYTSSIRVIQVANALESLRMTENSLGLKLMGILSNPRKESIFTEIACMGVGVISTVLNEKDSDEDLGKKINQLRLQYISVDKENFSRIRKLKKNSELPDLEYVVSFEDLEEADVKKAADAGLKLISFNETKKFDRQFSSKLLDIKSAAMIVFTSGTTGDAKAVRISHESLMETLTGLVNCSSKLTSEDILMSSTSCAVYSEKILIFLSTIFGASIGLSSNFAEDIKTLRPTLVYISPRYLDFLHSQIKQDLSFESSMTQKLFQSAYSKRLRSFNKHKDLKKNLWDNVAFNSTRDKFGGRLKLIFTGSGLVNIETLKFFKIVIGCDVIESYGSVESGEFTLCSGRDLVFGHVGGPLSSCEIKLNYLPDVTIEGIENNKYGELCIRHTSEPLGYLQESIVDSEGWMHTGDILRVNEGVFNFVFVERTEYVMKSKCGWAVLPQKLEHIYRQSEYVAQILVYSDVRINGLVAVVVPDQGFAMKNWVGRVSDFKTLCKGPELSKYILKNLREVATAKGLKAYEFVREIVVEAVPWTSKEFITSNLKVKRNVLIKRYENQFEEIVQKVLRNSS